MQSLLPRITRKIRNKLQNSYEVLCSGKYSERLENISDICINRETPFNVGDLYCSPERYYPELENVKRVDLQYLSSRQLGPETFARQNSITLGGGGILYYREAIKTVIQHAPKKLFGWGLGLNSHSNERESDSFLKESMFLKIGIRDFNVGLPWVPCVSCKHPEFDVKRQSQHEVVVYEHLDFPLHLRSFPKMKNKRNTMKNILNFLGSGNTVVTNSYHGAYWATLLGRKVVVLDPFSNKFNHFKHPLILSDSDSLKENIQKAPNYLDALEECRTTNDNFSIEVFRRMFD
ncbi:hypothetical protein GW915_06110 [bacterium]|nr:hypothetical protein [bacterium]